MAGSVLAWRKLPAQVDEQLSSAHFLADVVRSIGLTGDGQWRKALWCGCEAHAARPSQHVISGPIADIGSFGASRPAHTHTDLRRGRLLHCLTASVVAAFLRRVHSRSAHGRHFRGFVVDVTRSAIRENLALLQRLNVSFARRLGLDSRLLQPARGRSTPAYDLCFVDGDHSYVGVRKDYFEMAPFCHTHDVS